MNEFHIINTINNQIDEILFRISTFKENLENHIETKNKKLSNKQKKDLEEEIIKKS